jgi:disease resistance protein RPM1
MVAGTMEFATGAFGSLLPKLANLLHGEYKLQRDVRKNIEFVTKELETMQAALRNVGEVPLEQLPDLDRIWARDARELSYDMEDVVDNFLVHIVGPDPPIQGKWKEFTQEMKRILGGKRHQIGKQIEDVKKRVEELDGSIDLDSHFVTFSRSDLVFPNI